METWVNYIFTNYN